MHLGLVLKITRNSLFDKYICPKIRLTVIDYYNTSLCEAETPKIEVNKKFLPLANAPPS